MTLFKCSHPFFYLTCIFLVLLLAGKCEDPPPVAFNVTLSNQSIPENQNIGTFVGIFSTTDSDTDDSHSYTLVSGSGDTDNANFSISGDSLKSAVIFDFETQSTYSIRVQTDDGAGGTFEVVFSITVSDTNELPVITLSNLSLDENKDSGTVVGIFETVDQDAGDQDEVYTYSLVSGTGDTDNDSLLISGDTLKTVISFDYERRTSYSLRVVTRSSNGIEAEQVFTITVNNIAEWTLANPSADWGKRRVLNSVVFKSKIWITGGFDDAFTLFNDVWSSADGVSWDLATSSAGWMPRRRFSFTAFKDSLWFTGGWDDNINYNDVWASADGSSWVKRSDSAAWSARRNFSTVIFRDSLWIIGGTDHNDPSGDGLAEVWASGDGVNWIEKTNNAAFGLRKSHTSVVFDNRTWVLGGRDNNGNSLNDVWASEDGINWIEVNSSANWEVRNTSTSVVFNNRIWVIGGYNSNDDYAYNDIWSSTDGLTWQEELPFPSDEIFLSTSVVFNDKIWVLGGQGNDDGVWYYGL